MGGFYAIPAAALGFFLSSWLAMIFWGIIAPDLGIPTIGYTKALVVTIALWLVVAPFFAVLAKGSPKKPAPRRYR